MKLWENDQNLPYVRVWQAIVFAQTPIFPLPRLRLLTQHSVELCNYYTDLGSAWIFVDLLHTQIQLRDDVYSLYQGRV